MADKKISALTAATTPLAGTEVLPIVQSGATDKVSVADLTAGRDVSMAGATSTDHYKVAAGKGLAWSGNTASYITPEDNVQGARIAAGGSFKLLVGGGNEAIDVNFSTQNIKATAGNFVVGTAGKGIDFSANGGDVLTQYDEGTWNVTWANLTGTPTSTQGRYTRIGRMVFFSYYTGPGAISGTANSVSFSLPFTPAYGFSGSMIAGNITNAGSILIWTGGLAYPETFSASEMVFSGMFFV